MQAGKMFVGKPTEFNRQTNRLSQLQQRPKMHHELDPLSDDENVRLSSPSRESIKSFWIGCSGLAVLAIVASIGAFALAQLDNWLVSFLYTAYGQGFWNACYGIKVVIAASLIPGLVLGALVPVLYWRGGLLQRFAISFVLAVTTMNLTIEVSQGAWNAKVPVLQLIAILLCWLAMPILFLWTPINTRPLRLIVASVLMLLSLCLSILHMFSAPHNINLLYWEALYGASFCYALLRRNWGRVAILEAGTKCEQIERTSSRTLLELMAVCGLACAASMYWSTSLHIGAVLQLVQAIVLGIGCILVSMAGICTVLSWKASKSWRLFALWLLIWLLFGVNSAVYFAIDDPWGTGNWRIFRTGTFDSFLAIFVASSIASLATVGHICAVGIWLRWCGWRTPDRHELEGKT